MQGRSVLDAVEMAYAKEVYSHNEAAIKGQQHSLVDAFYNVSQQFQDKVNEGLGKPVRATCTILYNV